MPAFLRLALDENPRTLNGVFLVARGMPLATRNTPLRPGNFPDARIRVESGAERDILNLERYSIVSAPIQMTLRETMIKVLIVIIISIALPACSTGLFSVHKIDIQQGNALDGEDLEKLHEGMSRDAVIQALGRPVLKPVLNNDRWEYVYYLKKPDTPAEKRRLVILFDSDRVRAIEKSIR